MLMTSLTSPQYPAKEGGTIPGELVHGVEEQGIMDGPATCYPIHGVKEQGIMDGSATCNKRRWWRFGSWNVGTMNKKSVEIADELWRRKVDVCAVQETRWKGERTRFVGAAGERYKFWWKGDDGSGGVGIMVKEELVDKVIAVERKSDRVIVVVMSFGKVMVRVISAYAPQQSRKEEEKVKFYDDVSEVISQVGPDEFVVLLGDFNGHVGRNADGYEGVHGGFGYGERNDEGRRLLELADAHGMVVGNTLFTRSLERSITYRSGEHKSMIDYVLVRARDRRYLKNVKVIPGMLQHGMVVADIVSRGWGKREKNNFVPKRKSWLLKDVEVKREFEKKVVESWGCESKDDGSKGDIWNRYRDCVLEAADEVCGWTKGTCRHGETWWWDDSVKKAIDTKRKTFKEWRREQTIEKKAEYNAAKKCAKKAVACARKEASEKLMDEMEADNSSKKIFKIARQTVKDGKDVIGNGCVRDEMGTLCVGERERCEVWKRHMEKVMNEENEWDGIAEAAVVHGPLERVTEEEVKDAIKHMKLGRAAGVSGVAVEHIAASGMVGVEVITEICNRVLDGICIPDDWRYSVLVPLYKGKGDVRDCGAYRGVKLLEHGMKVLERVFERRLRAVVDIDEMQCGFMPGKGTVDALFMVRILQEKYMRKNKKLYMCFVDLEKAFDRVPRKVIEWALRKRGVNERLVKAVMRLYEGAMTKVKVGGGMSDGFSVEVGVHQGSVLSPFLFAIVMDVLCEDVREGLLFEILYADDLVLMADSMEELRVKFDKWKNAIEKKGLKVNLSKTKVMVSGIGGVNVVSSVDPCGVCDKRVKRNSILCVGCKKWVHKRCSGVKGALQKVEGVFQCERCVGGVVVDNAKEDCVIDDVGRVESFVYLGDELNAGGGCLSAVTARVRVGWRKFRELSEVLCGKKWSVKMKGKLYKTSVRTAMVYGAETWAMRKVEEGVLLRAERAMVRMMCGVKLRNRKKTSELMSMLEMSEDIVTLVGQSRMRWYGHVMRRDVTVGIRKVLDVDVAGKVGKGRPRMEWRQRVERDVAKVGLLCEDVSDRPKWRSGLRSCH